MLVSAYRTALFESPFMMLSEAIRRMQIQVSNDRLEGGYCRNDGAELRQAVGADFFPDLRDDPTKPPQFPDSPASLHYLVSTNTRKQPSPPTGRRGWRVSAG